MEGNVLPSHADVAARYSTILDKLSGDKLCRINPQREIGGVSQKMLNQTLRRLEQDGLVERQVYPVVPPKVEYSLTPLGRTLIEPLRAICKWAEQHLHKLEAA